jgi:glycerophosphoryl diester phosphodiesterase
MAMNYAKKVDFFLFLTCVMMSMCEGKSIEVQGHRGARGIMLENTLPAFKSAIEIGVDELELDLVITKDGELVIFHDFFINPEICTNFDGTSVCFHGPLIYSLFLDQVKQFKYKQNQQFPRQVFIPETQIPTLQELFTMILTSSHPHAKKIRLNLELKRDPNHPEYTPSASLFAKKVIDLVKENQFSKRVYYSSFDTELLSEVRKIDPEAMIGYLKEGDLEGFIEKTIELKADIVSPEHILLTNADFVHFFKERGIKVIPWTINHTCRVMELVEMGVDGIITDYPEEVIKFLEENNLRHTHD